MDLILKCSNALKTSLSVNAFHILRSQPTIVFGIQQYHFGPVVLLLINIVAVWLMDVTFICRIVICTLCKSYAYSIVLSPCVTVTHIICLHFDFLINPLTPNDPYRGRTAPLTSKVAFYIFIQQI